MRVPRASPECGILATVWLSTSTVNNLWITLPYMFENKKPWCAKGLFILVDCSAKVQYNRYMTQTNTIRKKRTDRNHIIYELRVAGGNYIGVTAKTESTINKSVLARAAKHCYRAKREAKDWALCHALRTLSDKSEIEVLIHEVVRGKAEAHKREVLLRRQINPTLNTDVRGD